VDFHLLGSVAISSPTSGQSATATGGGGQSSTAQHVINADGDEEETHNMNRKRARQSE
jgi:hypothetical protein